MARLGKRDICVLVRVGWTAEWSDRAQESSVPERCSNREEVHMQGFLPFSETTKK